MNYFNKYFKPKCLFSHTALCRVLLIIFATFLININNLSAQDVSRIDLAEHWAPVIYQKVDVTGSN